MANEEQLAILKQGGEMWNDWMKVFRREHVHLEERVNLSGADLTGVKLSSRVDLIHVILAKANLSQAVLPMALLGDADLYRAVLDGANLSGADARGANLHMAFLRKTDLSGALLYRVNLTGADLRGANLSGASLSGAQLYMADLRGASLAGADLFQADLSRADLHGTDLSYARMWDTRLNDLDLRDVRGLETVRHNGVSDIGVRTLSRLPTEIPEGFLRGVGVPEHFIAARRLMSGQTAQSDSRAIRFSSPDQVFAERLYADLQANGVRCWFAPEDLKIGDKFWDRIDEPTCLHDKLLVVLSAHSVESTCVEREVTSALEKEDHSPGRSVLFPIRLDETVMTVLQPWAADLRRRRHIGDFSRWKEHDAYQQAFTRLLRDLQAEPG